MRRYWGIDNDNQTKLDVDETKRKLMDMALASNRSVLISGLESIIILLRVPIVSV